MKSRKLRERRHKLIVDARAISDRATAEGRDLTSEERATWDKLFADADTLLTDIEREERLEAEERDAALPLREDRDRPASATAPGPEATDRRLAPFCTPEYRAAFNRYLTGGMHATGMSETERRALSAGVDTEGGYLRAPVEWVKKLIKAVDDEVFIRGLASKETVVEAAGMGVPSLDADPADADWTPEPGTGSEDSTMAFGGREMYPHAVAKRIKVSKKMLRQVPSVEALVMARLAHKFAVTHEKAFLTGDGAAKPLGVFTASAQGISTGRDVTYTATNDSTKADSFKDAKYAIKGAYWPRLNWVMHRDVVKILAKLKETTYGYLWTDSLVGGEPDRFLGFPVRMSEYAPNTISSTNYIAILGDFSFYQIVDALSMSVQGLFELYAETNQTGYIGRMETDGAPMLEEAFARLKHA